MKELDPMIDVFVFEARQLLETLEDNLLLGEKERSLNEDQINEIFRIMHTIKGSSAMMSFDDMAKISHAVEDLFSKIRDKKARSSDWDNIFEIVLSAADIIKGDVDRISVGEEPVGKSAAILRQVENYLEKITHRIAPADDDDLEASAAIDGEEEFDINAPYYKIKVIFEPECQMESMRAFSVVNELKRFCSKMVHIPDDLMADSASETIVKNGFILYIQSSANPDSVKKAVDSTMFLQTCSVIDLAPDNEDLPAALRPAAKAADGAVPQTVGTEVSARQNFISVNVNKIDTLMDLVGEIVTTESMVTKNPEITKLQIESFDRASQQLKKLINSLQDIVMSVRMLPVSTTFHKMNRLVRDMSKKEDKEVDLVIIGEETEVDKNIIDNLSDPLMHLIRNAVDHGLEHGSERIAKGKPSKSTITLEARNTGGDVMIIVSDDGRGLKREQIIRKAIEKGLTSKSPEEISDKEAYSFIFLPGFSTNDQVTEYSGRGVGMDVVRRNIDKVGGTVSIDSTPDVGTTIMIRIPLTLAIIEGMKLSVGDLIFIVPVLSIQESFKPSSKDIFIDPDGNEMIMLRGECYSILRLHELFGIETNITDPADGILIRITTDTDTFCIFADELLGQQQAVIKPLPSYVQSHNNNMSGIGGCAILGDGSISLIIDINNLIGD